jgi:catechol-2,3-dioxygenase
MVIEEIVSQGDGSRSVTGVELYRDRPQDEWPRTADGELAMVTCPLDVEGLLSELG